MRINLNFPYTQDTPKTEVIEFLTNLTKQYCLEAEWKKLQPLFTKFYTAEVINPILEEIKQTSCECYLVIKLLNHLYMNHHWGNEGLARETAHKVADRCGCFSSFTF